MTTLAPGEDNVKSSKMISNDDIRSREDDVKTNKIKK